MFGSKNTELRVRTAEMQLEVEPCDNERNNGH